MFFFAPRRRRVFRFRNSGARSSACCSRPSRQKPAIYLPGVTTFEATCPFCKRKHIKPYRKEWPGTDGYSLPDVGLGG